MSKCKCTVNCGLSVGTWGASRQYAESRRVSSAFAALNFQTTLLRPWVLIVPCQIFLEFILYFFSTMKLNLKKNHIKVEGRDASMGTWGASRPQIQGSFKNIVHAAGASACIGKLDQFSTRCLFIWLDMWHIMIGHSKLSLNVYELQNVDHAAGALTCIRKVKFAANSIKLCELQVYKYPAILWINANM